MSLFVTGTDTGIGKTFVSTFLALQLNWKYWKPIQSGIQTLTDSEFAIQHLGASKVIPEVYRLTAPLSPHLSARLDGVEIQIETILNVHKRLFDPSVNPTMEPMVIEGAGGLLVPLNEKNLMIDLIQAFNFPCLLVARLTLGTINHTLLSLEALRARNIEIAGIVLVGPPNRENRLAIENFGSAQVLAEIPWFDELSSPQSQGEPQSESQDDLQAEALVKINLVIQSLAQSLPQSLVHTLRNKMTLWKKE